MSQHREIMYAGRRIALVLKQTDKGRLTITVEPDLSVIVTAPANKSEAEIAARVRRRGSWIVKQLAEFETFLPKQPPRRYISGESHRYLGRQYRLKVEREESEVGVTMRGGHLHVAVRNTEKTSEVKDLLDEWYRRRGRDRFQRCVEEAVSKHGRLGLKVTGIRIQRMSKRWGSYTPSGRILLNPELIKTPVMCIEYVVIHELCHGVVPNHGRKFEALLTRCLPDWRERKARLERFAIG